MATLENAIALAVRAHQGQKDKAGAPYILHPLRLMFKMKSDHARMAAILHDVIEDTSTTLDDLHRAGYPKAVIAAVDCLTRRQGETYEKFMSRARRNPLARQVKLADLEDNMDIRRLSALSDKDLDRLKKYHRFWQETIAAA